MIRPPIRRLAIASALGVTATLVMSCSGPGVPPSSGAALGTSPAAPSQAPGPAAEHDAAAGENAWPAAPVVPLATQPPPHLVVDAPLPDQLAKGLVVIRYRAENVHIVPVYGPNALDVSPRLGHLHVSVDDLPWHWVDASGEPLTIQFLPPGTHKVWIGLADPTHKIMDSRTLQFVVPETPQNQH